MKLIHFRITAVVVVVLSVVVSGCSRSSAGHITDEQYKAQFGKDGDAPPAAYSAYLKSHSPAAVVPDKPAAQ